MTKTAIMKIIKFFAVILISTTFFACSSNEPSGDKAVITEKQDIAVEKGQVFTVDTTDSRIHFTGYGVGKKHPGTFHLSSGSVAVLNNQITGGDFIINVRSLDLDQKEGMFQDKLKPHLLSGDFFDGDKFGTAKFAITKVEPYAANGKDTSIVEGANFTISGNLTIKDVTKNVSFPAKVDLDGNTLKAKGNFDINRRDWQMNYGNDKTLGDKFISEKVTIGLDLKAVKG